MSSQPYLLHDHPVSSYAQKVRIALRLKNLPFTPQTPPNLGSGSLNSPLLAANPRMEVPALVDVAGDFAIFDSTAILMYLEDAHPSPALLPKDPKARAEARMIEEVCDTHYEAVNWSIGEIKWFERAEGAEAERLMAAAEEQTGQLQEWLTTKLGSKSFFNGTRPGYADIAVAPIVNRSVHYGYGPREGSSLQLWHERMSEVPAVRETFAEMAEGAKQMASGGSGTFAKGSGRRREYRDHRLEWMVKNGALRIVQKGIEEDTVRFGWPHPKI